MVVFSWKCFPLTSIPLQSYSDFVFRLEFAGTPDELDRHEFFECGTLGYNCLVRVLYAGDAVPVGPHTD